MNELISINPSNYQQLGSVGTSTLSQIKQKIVLAHRAKRVWQETPIKERIKLLKKVSLEIKSRKQTIALLESREMGMPITEALVDVEGSIDYMNWYFNNAEKYLSPEITFKNKTEIHEVRYEPIGVTALIVPWNFPLANFVWGAVQSLICGNVIVMKHSEEVPLFAKFIEEIMAKQGLPEGVFNMIYGDGNIGWQLVNQDIDLISFTGSTMVGKRLHELAGKKFIKALLELGGSAPGIIFPDSNLNQAVENVCSNRLLNQGQCCDGLKRLIVHESIFKEVVKQLKTIFENKQIGNAENMTTQIGPLVAKRQLELLKLQVKESVNKGARIITGGKSLEEKMGGAFFEPTILTEITPDMRVWKEEVFGPVLPVVKFRTTDEAIKLANDTIYGLGSYLYTSDHKTIDYVTKALKTGMVNVNGTNYVMPFNPFGGYKNSGFGREHGKYGFHELSQIKIIARNR